MKKLIAGNWKMNGTSASATQLVEEISVVIERDLSILDYCDFLICPPFPYLQIVRERLFNTALGGQDCSSYHDGAYTGDVSAAMLEDIGCQYVILGHSERRALYQEGSGLVAEKAQLAHQAGLVSIVCVGESEQDREEGKAKDVVAAQLDASLPSHVSPENTVIAYEPVWAIGTGKTASVGDIAEMHAFIREKISARVANAEDLRILYGGSVKAANAGEIFGVEDVNGALIGGASLESKEFIGIAREARRVAQVG